MKKPDITWALTPEAKALYEKLAAKNLDADLIIEIVELVLGEENVYDA
jgi:hypothetical protein